MEGELDVDHSNSGLRRHRACFFLPWRSATRRSICRNTSLSLSEDPTAVENVLASSSLDTPSGREDSSERREASSCADLSSAPPAPPTAAGAFAAAPLAVPSSSMSVASGMPVWLAMTAETCERLRMRWRRLAELEPPPVFSTLVASEPGATVDVSEKPLTLLSK